MLTPIKAIRAKCLDCCCGSMKEVELCPCPGCSLRPFRFGKNPYRTPRTYTQEQKSALKARLSRSVPTTAGKEMHFSPPEGSYTPQTQPLSEAQQDQ